jgi:hypothetical protein
MREKQGIRLRMGTVFIFLLLFNPEIDESIHTVQQHYDTKHNPKLLRHGGRYEQPGCYDEAANEEKTRQHIPKIDHGFMRFHYIPTVPDST